MKQDHGESMDCFYLCVKEQMGTLNLQDKSSERIQELLILAQLVNCTHDDVLRSKALRDPDLKLKPFLNNARAHEMANSRVFRPFFNIFPTFLKLGFLCRGQNSKTYSF